jgi:NAD(P)-dependent dehydrogenase (short-subunit alcohol dehydrogenase family)
MAKSKGGNGGAIVNVSSGSAYIGIAGRELYTVSKGALNSLAIGLTASMTPDGAWRDRLSVQRGTPTRQERRASADNWQSLLRSYSLVGGLC